MARLWAMGKVKMPSARPAILAVHAMAKQLQDPGDAALCHGVGQGCSTVHTPRHAMGLPIYELTALVRHTPPELLTLRLEDKIRAYHQTLARFLTWGTPPCPAGHPLCRNEINHRRRNLAVIFCPEK